MGEETKVGISPSKVVALIGTLVIIRESIGYFITAGHTGDTGALFILFGILGLIFAFFLFLSLKIIEIKKLPIPYFWWILLIIGVLLVLFAFATGSPFLSSSFIFGGANSFYLGGILVLIAAFLEFLLNKKSYSASKIVALIGAIYAIVEAVFGIIFSNPTFIVLNIIGIIFAIILLLSIQSKLNTKIPFAWWVVLIVGFVIFTWISSNSGTVIMVAFILILMAY
jgi:hypothetical protein